MIKVAAVIWLMLGTVLAGVAMLVVLTVPQLMDQARLLIPVLCLGGFVLAIPFAVVIARQLYGSTAGA